MCHVFSTKTRYQLEQYLRSQGLDIQFDNQPERRTPHRPGTGNIGEEGSYSVLDGESWLFEEASHGSLPGERRSPSSPKRRPRAQIQEDSNAAAMRALQQGLLLAMNATAAKPHAPPKMSLHQQSASSFMSSNSGLSSSYHPSHSSSLSSQGATRVQQRVVKVSQASSPEFSCCCTSATLRIADSFSSISPPFQSLTPASSTFLIVET